MLSRLTRTATYAVAAVFSLLGAVLFVAPGWSAEQFPWRVSHFLAMTMGAWYAGTAVFAWVAARNGRWSVVRPALAYLWLFALGQALLVVVHEDVLDFDETLAWPYVLAVGAAAGAALVGILDVARVRPRSERGSVAMPLFARVLTAAFVVAVALLALPLVDGYDNPRSIWPGELTLISARGFAVFFGSLALSAALLLVGRALEPLVAYLRAGIVLNTLILVAAVVYAGQFDVGDHPGQLLYLGLYASVLVLSVALLAYGRRRAAEIRSAAAGPR